MDNTRIKVELVEHSPGAPLTGIGRYTRELYNHLFPHISVRLTTHIDPPFTSIFSFLHHFPVGIKDHQPGSIVHFMEDLGCSQMWWRPVRPAIATSHDLGMLDWQPETKMHRPPDRLILRLSYLALKRMDAIITLSEYARQTIIRRLHVPPERVFKVYSGKNEELFRPVTNARAMVEQHYGLPSGSQQKYLLYVGSELPRKNVATLLKTLSLLPANVHLLKVGYPGVARYRAHTNRLIAKFNLAERVHLLNQVPDEHLPLLYNEADIYISASFLEGFGLPIVEAMACGTPVVCSNVSAHPEITNGAAVLVPPTDARAFANAVLSILEDNALREKMSVCSLHQATRFSWERTAEEVAAVYQRVIEHNKR